MKVLVLGSTGPTGRWVVREALARGHEVTAWVRDPAKLGPEREQVRIAAGSLPDAAPALRQALVGQQAVISALGVGQSFEPRGLMAGSVPVIVQSMEDAGVRRLVFTSAVGVGARRGDAPPPLRLMIALLLRKIYADKAIGEAAIAGSGLEWTIVHPTMLTDGPKTGHRAGERLKLPFVATVSRADVGEFLVDQLDDRSWVRRIVVVSR